MTTFSGEINATTVANQNQGMIPDLTFPAVPSAGVATTNRVFEPNLRAGIRLSNASAVNQYTGDWNTATSTGSGAITVAGWFRLDNSNTTSTVRLFDTGENTGTNGFFQITSGDPLRSHDRRG